MTQLLKSSITNSHQIHFFCHSGKDCSHPNPFGITAEARSKQVTLSATYGGGGCVDDVGVNGDVVSVPNGSMIEFSLSHLAIS